LVNIKSKPKQKMSGVATTATSCKDLKGLTSSLSSKQFVIKNNLKSSATTKTVKITKMQSALDCTGRTLAKSKSNALKPFPTVDPEFYQEPTSKLWQKEMSRISSEKTIMNRTFQEKSKNDANNKTFHNSDIFENRKTKKMMNPTTSDRNYGKQPKNVTIDLYRARDYHTHTNIFVADKSKNDEDVGRRSSNKAISPMHLKLYSSTMQKNNNDIPLPKSHPSYNKDAHKKEVLPPSTKKKLDLLKTNYNFLKSYY